MKPRHLKIWNDDSLESLRQAQQVMHPRKLCQIFNCNMKQLRQAQELLTKIEGMVQGVYYEDEKKITVYRPARCVGSVVNRV